MLSNEEKISLLRIERKKLVQIYESADFMISIPELCPVCVEAGRLITRPGEESACDICGQLGVKERCVQFVYLSGGFLGIAEEIASKKKIKDLIFEIKDEIDRISNE